ncbi:MAG: hypothetical protein PHE59_00880 [Patescibacteria group bacterium]|nr:hypothetical protein [Patescibacteria group bacterium]MDD5534186.1 hypothetical protein [Patescibacteria group bacterium]
MKIYFGHPQNVYNTDLEKRLLEKIDFYFPKWEIINPAEKCHQEEAKRLKQKRGSAAAMDYFIKLISDCEVGIFLPFKDNKWGAGIFKEAKNIAKRGGIIYKIDEKGTIDNIKFNLVKHLSIKETRARIRDKNGNFLPYC